MHTAAQARPIIIDQAEFVSGSDHVLAAGLCIVLMFGVLAFGVVDNWAIALQHSMALALLVIWVAGRFRSEPDPLAWHACLVPAALFAGLVGWQILSGHTAYRWASLNAAADYVTYGILLFIALQVGARRPLRHQLLVVLLCFGAALALFAIVQGFASPYRVYWYRVSTSGRAFPFGPYINHNHFAGAMELLAPFALIFSVSRRFRGGINILIAFAAVLMVGSIFLSSSRGGMFAIVTEVIFLAAVIFLSGAGVRTKILFAAVVVASVALLVWLGGERVADRLASVTYETRLAIDHDSWLMAKQHPVAGFGFGTFGAVYPQYRSFATNLYFDHAHNDYLELLVETGWIGVALMLAFLGLVYRSALRRRHLWAKSEGAAMAIGAAAGITGILVHSLSDFNLHIPANAALYFALAGIAVAKSR